MTTPPESQLPDFTSQRSAASAAKRPRWRLVLASFAILILLGFLMVAGLFWYASSAQFAARVHRALIADLERATGGRAEIGCFRWSARHLSIEVDNLTIHGREAANQIPYFHVDHLLLRASIVSFFTPEIALSSVVAQRPVLHLIVYPGGTTNQPQPQTASRQPLPQTILDLAIGRTRVENGLVLLNDRSIPWELAAGPLQVKMNYVAAQTGYRARIQTKNLTFRLQNAATAHSRLSTTVSLTRDALRIDSLDLVTGTSRLHVTGNVRHFAAPRWHALAQGTVDARQVGLIVDIPELRKGTAHVSIKAHGAANPTTAAAQTFQVFGHVDVRSGAWQAPWLSVRDVTLHTDVLIDDDQCTFTNVSSTLSDGGRIDGSLVMEHCVGPQLPTIVAPANSHGIQSTAALSPPAGYQPLQAVLQAHVSSVTLPFVMAAVAPKQFANIGFTTAASGDVRGRWTASGDGLIVRGVLTLSDPRQTLGLVPVRGPATATYLGDHRHLVIEHADLDTPGTQVHASGLLTLFPKDLNSSLHMDVTGTNLGEFDRLLTVLDLRVTPPNEPHALPLQLLGRASFHGDVRGSFFALQAVGHLDSQRFQMLVASSPGVPSAPAGRTALHAPAAARQPIQNPPIHLLTWDELHADLEYTPWRLIVRNGVLARGHAVIHTTMDLQPERTAPDTYTYNRRTRFQTTMRAPDASIADLQSVIGMNYPASGTVIASAHAAGTLDDMQGNGQLTLSHASLQGQEVPSASVQLRADGHVLTASGLQFASTGGTAAGQLIYDYESGALRGDLTGHGFILGQLRAWNRGRLPLGGTLGFHFQAAGTTAAPALNGDMQIEKMTLNHMPMGTLHAESHLQRGTLYLTSRADLLQTHLDAEGKVQLAGNYPAQFQMTSTGFNIDPLLRLVSPSGVGGQSAAQGRITMSGPIGAPAQIRADANLSALTATIGGLPIHSEGPVQISLRRGLVNLLRLRLRGSNVDLGASGTVDLLHDDQLRMHSEGTLNAALASFVYPQANSSGVVWFVLDARGTARQPNLRGRAQVEHLTVHVLNVTNGLTDMNGELLFDQDRLIVQQLKGYSGGGELSLGGYVGYRNGPFLDLTATTREVRIRYPKGISSAVDAKLRLLGNSDSQLLSGDVRMVRFGIGSNIDLTSLATGAAGVTAPSDPASALNRVRLDLHVTSAPELGFQNSFASMAGDINLRVRGTLENPSILGRVDISQGSASFAGTTYRLQQGDIVFANPVTISPEIDLEATARVQNYDIVISLHGPPSKLDISYRSEPPLTQSDVLALLALGRTNEQAAMYGEQQQQGANLTSEALLGGALNAAVSSRVQKLFGVGSVRVDPNFVGALGESTARVTVEEQVGKNITLTFATNINTTAQQLLQAQYDLTRNVSVIAVRDEADVFSMYLQIRGKRK
ncbi:MAG TPA: translocation/assembly module TamB domain-containing protein [Acidobacteriaceae bacterium]|nr:translocation/assembly module TamB domain-containing protein [Acidobacteriaceae bacterium]